MSLADRLSAVAPARSNLGCATCAWLAGLPEDDRKAIAAWIDDRLSISQLHDICASDEDHPLQVSDSAFRNHIRRHHHKTV